MERISLCKVVQYYDSKNQPKRSLQRYFDVDMTKKRLVPYCRSSPDPEERRPRIAMLQGLINEQSNVGAWGLWKWWKEEEHIKSEQYVNLSPIQIIGYSLESRKIVERLKNGVPDVRVKGNVRTLFANLSNGAGILCDWSDLEEYENYCRLRAGIFSLPRIFFNPDSILISDSNGGKPIYFFNELEPQRCPNPAFVYYEKAIIKALNSRLAQSCRHEEIEKLQNALKDVSTESISSEVARLCSCDKNDAHILIEQFLDNSRFPQLLCDGDVRILSRLLERNESFKRRCIEVVEERWKSEHTGIIAQINKPIDSNQEDLPKLQEEYQNLQHQKDNLQNEYDSERLRYREKLEKEKEELSKKHKETEEKLATAKKELDEYEDLIREAKRELNNTEKNKSVGEYSNKFISNREAFCEESKRYNDELDAVEILEDGLKGIGFEKKCANLTSSFLWSVYFNQRPLILAGSYAQRIAEVTSCALTGRLPDVLICEGACEQHIFDEAFADPDSILLVKNPLDGSWFERLASELSVRRKTVFLSVPFVENLRLIPSSFFDVALPYVTNLSVLDKSFDGNVFFKYGTPSEEFLPEFQKVKPVDLSEKASRIGMGRYALDTVERLLAYSRDILLTDEESFQKALFQFGLFSYAYATDSLSVFFDLLRENNVEFKRNNPFKDFEKFA